MENTPTITGMEHKFKPESPQPAIFVRIVRERWYHRMWSNFFAPKSYLTVARVMVETTIVRDHKGLTHLIPSRVQFPKVNNLAGTYKQLDSKSDDGIGEATVQFDESKGFEFVPPNRDSRVPLPLAVVSFKKETRTVTLTDVLGRVYSVELPTMASIRKSKPAMVTPTT